MNDTEYNCREGYPWWTPFFNVEAVVQYSIDKYRIRCRMQTINVHHYSNTNQDTTHRIQKMRLITITYL